MKFSFEQEVFRPVTITIESEYDLLQLKEVLVAATNGPLSSAASNFVNHFCGFLNGEPQQQVVYQRRVLSPAQQASLLKAQQGRRDAAAARRAAREI